MASEIMPKQCKAPLKVFCSYSHRDEDALDAFHKHLKSLELSGLIKDWHDRKIPPGGDWSTEIRDNLDAADLILLLISSDFIASDYCMNKETARALSRHDAGLATVVPVFLRECSVSGLSFERLQGTPRDMRWISQQKFSDKAWTEVTEAIKSAALDRLGLQTWLLGSGDPDPWDLPIQPSNENQPTDPMPASKPKDQTAFSSTGAGASSATFQSGHAYIATEGVDKEGSSFVRAGLWALLAAVVLLVAGWFVWNHFHTDTQIDTQSETKKEKPMATPTNNALLGVGKRYLDQGEYQKAQDSCQKAPESEFRKNCLAVTGLALNDVDDKQVFLAQTESNGSAYAEVLLGEFQLANYGGGSNVESLQLAESHFAKALKINVDLASVYFGRGQIQHFSGNIDAAIPLYQKAVNLAPKNGRFNLNLATATADAGQFAEAEELLRDSLTTSAEVLLAHAELVEVLVNQEKLTEAEHEAKNLQSLLIQRGSDVVCQPVNLAEWVVMQDGSPAFISSWADQGVNSWSEKLMYLNYINGLAGVSPMEVTGVNCD